MGGGGRSPSFVSQGGRCHLHEDVNSGIEHGVLWALCQLCNGREQEDGTSPGHLQAPAQFLVVLADGQGEPKLPSSLCCETIRGCIGKPLKSLIAPEISAGPPGCKLITFDLFSW